MKILLIEDEVGIANFIEEGLKIEKYLVDVAHDGQTGLDMAHINQYDLAILDLMLPDIDGICVCQQIRKSGFSFPIIMLTARDTIEDKIVGLDSGADDYLTKPFDLDELLARVRALLRRGQSNVSGNEIIVDDIILNTKTHQVTRQNKSLTLSNKEFKILEYMMRRPNEVISRQEILEHVWESDADPFSNTVEVHIRYLRQKIDHGFRDKKITTVRGSGYKLLEYQSNVR